MTEKTDIAALREASLMATAGEWCTDPQHSVIADAGLNANYYVAACSGPDSKANAKFISLANPATILALLDQLEAERQQREAAERKNALVAGGIDAALKLQARAEKAEAELAELRGAQKPVAQVAENFIFFLRKQDNGERWPIGTQLYARQPKPVVVHPDTARMDWLCAHVVEVRQPMFYGSHALFFGQCDSDDDEEYHSKLREQIDAAIEVGIVVKDGE